MTATTRKLIATGQGIEFWLIDGQVYRSRVGDALDIYDLPASRRWECALFHWQHYRANYDWAVDVEPVSHRWEADAPYCSCGQDTVTCQGCGKLVCGNVSLRVRDRNVGPCCAAKFGLGHGGGR